MKKGIKRVLYSSVVVLFALIVCVFAFIYDYTKPLEFETGWHWVSSEPKMSLSVSENGPITGYVVIDGEKVELLLYRRARIAHLYIKNKKEEIFVASGHYDLSNTKDLIIKNINYSENFDFGANIILNKID